MLLVGLGEGKLGAEDGQSSTRSHGKYYLLQPGPVIPEFLRETDTFDSICQIGRAPSLVSHIVDESSESVLQTEAQSFIPSQCT